MNRRKLLSTTLLGSTALITKAWSHTCSGLMTPQQPEGPFYPEWEGVDENWDLTKIKGSSTLAKGEIIFIEGTIKNKSCQPIQGARIEIWQACESGRYNHSGDTSNNPLDPNFQYWGEVITKEDGKFLFKTIKPGSYVASGSWTRPPHIHVKVTLRGYQELTTQFYFSEDTSLNARDLILQRLNSNEKNTVVSPLRVTQQRPQRRTAVYHIVLDEIA